MVDVNQSQGKALMVAPSRTQVHHAPQNGHLPCLNSSPHWRPPLSLPDPPPDRCPHLHAGILSQHPQIQPPEVTEQLSFIHLRTHPLP